MPLQVIGKRAPDSLVSGMYIINTKKGPYFFADTTVNLNPTTEDLVEITLQTVRAVKELNVTPRVAMLSYSNFGSIEIYDSNLFIICLQLVEKLIVY